MITSSSAEVVREFFGAFGAGDRDRIIATFHPEAQIVAVRSAVRNAGELYGRYAGTAGVNDFVTTLGQTFVTQAFAIDGVVGDGSVAFASGSFIHVVKSTGRAFTSDWALRCVIKDGKIFEYRFFEDSAAFVDATR